MTNLRVDVLERHELIKELLTVPPVCSDVPDELARLLGRPEALVSGSDDERCDVGVRWRTVDGDEIGVLGAPFYGDHAVASEEP